MKLRHKSFAVSTEGLAEKRQVLVTVSTDQLDRTKDVMVQPGIDLTNFRSTKTVLWNHNQDNPVAWAESIDLVDNKLQALVQFPDVGVNEESDRIYGLIKAGVINAASIGFLTLDAEPLDGKNPKKGIRILKSELLEFSFVSVPANPGAIIQERAMPAAKTKTVGKITLKGLYSISQLASILGSLGYMAQDAAWEREYEGDASQIPEVLADLCRGTGQALLLMTAEEIAELLSTLPGGIDGTHEASKSVDPLAVIVKRFADRDAGPSGAVTEKAGRKLSADTKSTLGDACKSIADGHAMVKAGHDAIKAMVDDSGESAGADDAEAKTLRDAQTKNLTARAKRLRQVELALAA